MIKICEECGEEFNAKYSKQKCCSWDCSIKARSKKNNKVLVVCKHCGKEVERYKSQCLTDVFCSKKCLYDYTKVNHSVTFNCEICGKSTTVTKSNYDKSKNHYCSYECSNIGHSRYYRNENHPRYEGLKYNCDYCNKEFPIKRSYLKDHKNHFCSMKCKDKWQGENIRGENHPSYKHGLSKEYRIKQRINTEYYDWRKSVYNRDKYTCQCCRDNKGGNLVAHHILNYSEYEELRTDINNGITLCSDCHKEFHNTYGYRNNNLDQLNKFIYTKNEQAS